ncbi:MAG: phage baseplate protein [Acidobacteriota bacterium]
MRIVPASDLLDAWERAAAQPPAQRPLTLLAAASEGATAETLAGHSVGRRDADLLSLREQIFGPRLVSVAGCPSCGERLELTFDASEIRAAAPPETAETLSVAAGGYAVEFRLPDSLDVMSIAGSSDVAAARLELIERCLLRAAREGADVPPSEVPDEIIDAVAARMGEADPQADVQLDLECPSCAHRWLAIFDIVSFLWSELNAWAHRTLQDVHVLASAYGWRESDILSLTPWRRHVYLEMVGG